MKFEQPCLEEKKLKLGPGRMHAWTINVTPLTGIVWFSSRKNQDQMIKRYEGFIES